MLAAYRLLASRGFEGLRTRDVAAEVGVNIATLHYYFPTKELLIRAVLEHAMGRFRSTMNPAGRTGDLLRAHFDGVVRLHREEPELFAVMGELHLRSARDPVIRGIVGDTRDTWRRSVRGLLQKAVKEGSLPALRDPDATASLVVAVLTGAFMLPLGRPENVRDAVRELQRYLGLLPS
ncbi:MAG: TetR/AcrR family transcriptional regulator [Acetobacteraceae bacterium]